MTGSGGTTVVGSGGSGSGGSGGGGSADYAAEAGHAQTADHAMTADEATHATTADTSAEATHATSADTATSADSATTATTAQNLASDSTDWNKIADKTIAQSISEVWTFAKGIVSTLVSKFKAGILIGANDDYGINADGDATLRNISGVNISGSGDATIGGDLDIDGNTTIDSDLNVGADATVSGKITAAQLIASLLKTPGFAQVAGMIGLGFGVTTDQNGRATLQTDDLVVLGKMIVNALNVREVTYIGGTYLLTPAGSTIAKVMRLYAAQTSQIQYSQYWTTTQSNYAVGYRVMWKADDGTTGTMNYWKVGDQAFCQTFNLTASGQYSTAENRRYWRLVCRVGQVTVDGETFHYADLADIDSVYLYGIANLFAGRENANGSVPAEGDKVVCLGSQTDTTRQGAIQLTAEGEASIGIYDGINDYSTLSNFEIHYFSKSAVRMNAAYITWKTTGGNETQANFMATTKQAFIGIGNCGIDFTNGSITAKGGKFQMEDENGNPTFVLDQNGNINGQGNATFGGIVRAKTLFRNVMQSDIYYGSANFANADHSALNADYMIVIGSSSSTFTVNFPPAYLFPGALVRIITGRQNLVTYTLQIGRLAGEDGPHEESGAGNEAVDNFYAAIPFVNSGGTTIYGSRTQLTCNTYRTIDLIAAENPEYPNNYVWMVIDVK